MDLENDLTDQKNKWLQQEGNLFFGIAQAKCRLKIIIIVREPFLWSVLWVGVKYFKSHASVRFNSNSLLLFSHKPTWRQQRNCLNRTVTYFPTNIIYEQKGNLFSNKTSL